MGVFRMLQVGLKCILQEFQECVKNISSMDGGCFHDGLWGLK